MFIELADILRCPGDHPDAHCVLTPETMVERNVVAGTVACPVCKREYTITDGVVRFGAMPPRDAVETVPDADAVHALLGLGTPGGYGILLGSVTRLGEALVERIDGVHFVVVNPPPRMSVAARLSVLHSAQGIPLRGSATRGAVLGGEYADDAWLRECVRVLMPGARLVVAREVDEVAGVRRLAVGGGMFVGEKGEG